MITNEILKIIEFDATKTIQLEFVKNYLRIDNDCDDEFLKNAITTANNYAEKILNKVVCIKTFELSFSISSDEQITKIDKKPSISIDEIVSVYVNEQEEGAENYGIENGVLIFKIPVSGNIKVVFKSGFNTENIPAEIKQAIICHVATIYQNKNGDFEAPKATQEIYNLHRKIRI